MQYAAVRGPTKRAAHGGQSHSGDPKRGQCTWRHLWSELLTMSEVRAGVQAEAGS